MNHMSLPDDNFQTLLADYAKDTVDDGFSDAIIASISEKSQFEARLRRFSLLGAMFIGGVIAGSQFLRAVEILDGSTLTSAFSSVPLMSVAVILCIPLTVWLLEQREISL